MTINLETCLLGVIGNPLTQSLSPLMHNAVFDHLGLNCLYLPLEIAAGSLEKALDALKVLGFTGVNVTIPYKTEVIPYLDVLSEEAEACQAVNCIKNEQGRLTGYNTDGQGFMRALKEAGVESGEHTVIIGAGGAARSVAYNLARSGCRKLEILDIEVNRADDLAMFIENVSNCTTHSRLMTPDNFEAAAAEADLIINCSPVGMMPQISKSPVDSLAAAKNNAVICDLIYNPIETRFLQLGRERGLKTINGAAMFIHQGALTLEILLGITPPLAFMKEVVTNQLEGKRRNIN